MDITFQMVEVKEQTEARAKAKKEAVQNVVSKKVEGMKKTIPLRSWRL